MSNDPNNNPNNNKNQGGKGVTTGVSASVSITPNDIKNPDTMAGFGTILMVGAGACVALRWLIGPVAKHIFGVKNIAPVKPTITFNDIKDTLTSAPEFSKDGAKSGIATVAFNALSEEGKAKFLEHVGKK